MPASIDDQLSLFPQQSISLKGPLGDLHAQIPDKIPKALAQIAFDKEILYSAWGSESGKEYVDDPLGIPGNSQIAVEIIGRANVSWDPDHPRLVFRRSPIGGTPECIYLTRTDLLASCEVVQYYNTH